MFEAKSNKFTEVFDSLLFEGYMHLGDFIFKSLQNDDLEYGKSIIKKGRDIKDVINKGGKIEDRYDAMIEKLNIENQKLLDLDGEGYDEIKEKTLIMTDLISMILEVRFEEVY